MRRILGQINSLLRRAPKAEEQAAPRFVVSVPARLLAGITDAAAMQGAPARPKIVGGTLNVSASGLAILVPSLDAGAARSRRAAP